MYGVYVKTDDKLCIIDVTSSAFLDDASGWVKIDEGVGDKYHHAQGNYFPDAVTDERGIPRYKLLFGEVVQRTAQEMAADVPAQGTTQSQEDRIAQLEEALSLLLSGVTE